MPQPKRDIFHSQLGQQLLNPMLARTITKKRNQAATGHCKAAQTFKPVSSHLNSQTRASYPSHGIDDRNAIKFNSYIDLDSTQQYFENLVPQKQWDELLDRAFDTIRDAASDIFDEERGVHTT